MVSLKYSQSTKMGASQAKMESDRERGRGMALGSHLRAIW
jgi:hypothetical protein